jgi:hypothetical protein
MSVGLLVSSFTPRFRASASINQTLDTQRSAPAPPRRTVREVLPHTAPRCSSSEGIHGLFVPADGSTQPIDTYPGHVIIPPSLLPVPPRPPCFLAQK